jgi:putative colanic acid biosynthesis glycosyltransferase
MKFSIITVNYNNGDALDSVEIIKKYDVKLAYWVSEKDNGIYHAMNKAIRVASGDYCLFLNSGDTFYDASVLENIQPFLTADFVCGNACLTYGESVSSSIWEAPMSVNKLYFIQRLSVCHQSLFIRTSILKNRGYDESLRIVADYEQIFFEILVNRRTYRKADIVVCNYGCDGISSNHEKSDAEKRAVLEKFRLNNYIECDALQELINTLKIGTRKYKLVLYLAKFIVNGFSIFQKWIKK